MGEFGDLSEFFDRLEMVVPDEKMAPFRRVVLEGMLEILVRESRGLVTVQRLFAMLPELAETSGIEFERAKEIFLEWLDQFDLLLEEDPEDGG